MPTSIEQSFSWAQWTPNTSLTLCNVPWDSSYRDVVRFADEEARQRYFESLDSVDVEHATMHKFGQPVLLEIPFNEASNWNYLVAYNDYPTLEAPRRWYYFIQNVEYVNAHTTRMNIMLDVWQSFLYDWELGRSYITRGHIGMANEKSFEYYGRDYLTYPEGLDTGSSMHVRAQRFAPLTGQEPHAASPDYQSDSFVLRYGVIIVSTVDLSEDPGTDAAPKLKPSSGLAVDNCISGADLWYMPSIYHAWNVLGRINFRSWIAQGLVKCYMVPKTFEDYFRKASWGGKIGKFLGRPMSEYPENARPWYLTGSVGGASTRNPTALRVDDFRSLFHISDRYRNVKKLFTYPYCAIEMTCNNGQSLVLQPELISSNNLEIKTAFSYSGVNPRVQYYVPKYNCAEGVPDIRPYRTWDNSLPAGVPLDGGEQFGASVGVQEMPSFMLVNNGGALALANSAYTRQFAEQSAQWTADKARMSTGNAREQAGIAADYASQRTAMGNRQANAMNDISSVQMINANTIAQTQQRQQSELAKVNNVANGISGFVGNLVSGNWGGAVQSAVGTAQNEFNRQVELGINVDAQNANLANNLSTNAARTAQSNNYSTALTNVNNRQQLQFADMNYELANKTISGDYANQIAGINAQVQQMKLTPPTVTAQAGGDAFNLSNGIMGLQLKFKTCEPSALTAAGEYFLRYGYFVQRFLTPPKDLKCMTNFTYWQMAEAYVSASRMPEQYRMTIKGILEAGTTVWTRPGDIGTIDYANNEPINGISY